MLLLEPSFCWVRGQHRGDRYWQGLLRRRYAYPCLDWSERVAHVGGHLGSALLNWLIAEKALVWVGDSRALRVTVAGSTLLEKTFDLRVGIDASSVTSLEHKPA